MLTISTDTSCDVLRCDLDAAGIPWVPLTFTINGETYPDDFTRDEQYKDFYAKVRGGAMPTTSQITAFAHEEYFEKLVAGGADDVLHITLSGGLSATYSSACMAAKAVCDRHPECKINIVDSLGATQVHNFVLDKALSLRAAGKHGDEAAEIVREFTKRVHVLFMVDDLDHLRRGGRVSGVAAAIGNLLKIKPILSFDREGKLRVVHKARGFRKSMDYVIENIKKYAPYVNKVFIAQGDAMDNAEEAAAMLKDAFGCEVRIGWCGPVIGAHTGAGIIGIIFESKALRPL